MFLYFKIYKKIQDFYLLIYYSYHNKKYYSNRYPNKKIKIRFVTNLKSLIGADMQVFFYLQRSFYMFITLLSNFNWLIIDINI